MPGDGGTWVYRQNQILSVQNAVDLQGNDVYDLALLSVANSAAVPGALLSSADSIGTLQWVPPNGSTIRTGTATSYNVLPTDAYIGVTDTSAPRTVTLFAAAYDNVGKIITVKDEGSEAFSNNITINVAGGGTVNGASSVLINANYGVVGVYSNGSAWLPSDAGRGGAVRRLSQCASRWVLIRKILLSCIDKSSHAIVVRNQPPMSRRPTDRLR